MFFFACENATEPNDIQRNDENPIQINQISQNPENVHVNDIAWITVDYDYDGTSQLNFLWNCTSGNFINNKSSNGIAWQAPHRPGYYSVSVMINDSCSRAQDAILIKVIPDDEIGPEMA
ncbi:MAG: hypothetical protein ACLFSQ_02425 [Candidatus Zixiibacteriota bacterium]